MDGFFRRRAKGRAIADRLDCLQERRVGVSIQKPEEKKEKAKGIRGSAKPIHESLSRNAWGERPDCQLELKGNTGTIFNGRTGVKEIKELAKFEGRGPLPGPNWERHIQRG